MSPLMALGMQFAVLRFWENAFLLRLLVYNPLY